MSSPDLKNTAETQRLLAHRERQVNWKNWGPYLSERGWGTVREDYSPDGRAWDYFPHDHARSRAYRWNEDGLAGICDRNQYICFALALWNGRDPILKERLFGLTGHQGNHGEDVKEAYFYLDNLPTHSYMTMLYKYPQLPFPYGDLVAENGRRGRHEFEYELVDTSAFAENRYFDVTVTYAKASEEDICIAITATNRGPDPAPLHLLPTLWLRNTWSWGYPAGPMGDVPGRPLLRTAEEPNQAGAIAVDHPAAGRYTLHVEQADKLLFTENETNFERLFATPNPSPFVKDAFHRYLIANEQEAVNPAQSGTKAAALFHRTIPAGESWTIRLRLRQTKDTPGDPFADFDEILAARRKDADAFYDALHAAGLDEDGRRVQRQALAGMLWTKQLYYFDIPQWLAGDPAQPRPAAGRRSGRNHEWTHLNNFDIISMPDKWEYPWYAAWDLAFHCLPLALVDPDYAKRQLVVMLREWYMHPNGQLPAYEWAFEDVNPPVHAWGAWRVYQLDAAQNGRGDRPFLERVFHKLLLNFTWWVNRKDVDGNNVFQGGFLGLDNVSLFDRSAALPHGGHIDQSDGTAWMGFYCLTMMRIALELAKENPVYQDVATKFYEHFLAIAVAMTGVHHEDVGLWDEEDGFFYDVLHLPDGSYRPLKVRSLVGLIPLIAVEVIEPDLLRQMGDFKRRMDWFTSNRPELSGNMAEIDVPGKGERILTAVLTPERLRRVLGYMLDPDEFLSPYGIRSLSKAHSTPYTLQVGDESFSIHYQPAESDTALFGGNSNWRGPIWFPTNYLLIEALRKFHTYYGDAFTVEYPTGSGVHMNLSAVADELARRLEKIFLRGEDGRRPVYGGSDLFQNDPHWRDLILFFEYFHGENGAGLGASHQTGWTGLIANLLQEAQV